MGDIGWRWKALDRLRAGLGSEAIEDMTLADIQAAREPYTHLLPDAARGVAERIAQAMFGRPPAGVEVRAGTVGGAVGDLPARIHAPRHLPAERPIIVHLHGGGFVVGSPVQYDWLCGVLADEVGATVVSVDYRKAPEHPAPAAADDARAAFTWVSQNRAAFRAGEPIAVVGDSAGGNLSALAALHARDHGLRLDAQVLIYPGVDLALTFPSIRTKTNEPILPRTSIEAFMRHYLAASDVAADDPVVSPWWADDHTGLAPALVQTAEHDPLVDEGDAYAEKLRAAGVEVRHTRYVGVPHGFMSLPGITSAARQGAAEIVAFLRSHLDVA